MMIPMTSAALLIAGVLASCPLKLANHGGEERSWLSAAVVGSQLLPVALQQSAEPVLGFQNGQPQPLLLVDLPSSTAAAPIRVEVHTALAFSRMEAAARRFGLSLQVNSGFRTQEQQQEVFALYRKGRGPLAARPGFSNHQSGHALDLDMQSPRVRSWLFRHAHRYGFQRTVPSERWHWEFRGDLRKLLGQPDPLQPRNS
jgi:LAS superfamily LD-carboxypeptidase LdcB